MSKTLLIISVARLRKQKRKHLRGSVETAKKRKDRENVGQMKRQVEVIQELKTGRLVLTD